MIKSNERDEQNQPGGRRFLLASRYQGEAATPARVRVKIPSYLHFLRGAFSLQAQMHVKVG